VAEPYLRRYRISHLAGWFCCWLQWRKNELAPAAAPARLMTSLKRLLRLLPCAEVDDREWRRQYVSDNRFYRFINFQKAGTLVDAFNIKSSREQRTDALNRVIREDIVQCLYSGGEGKLVRSKCNPFAPQTNVSPVNFTLFSAFKLSLPNA